MQNQSIKEQEECEGKKKLFMKWALNSMRKYFNINNLPYHLLSTCVSIKPGSSSRCATLQSYPNKGVWKCLSQLPENIRKDLKEHFIEEIKHVEHKFQQSILIEFQKRANKDFDFANFYKEIKSNDILMHNSTLENETNDTPQLESEQKDKQVKQKKWSKGQDFISESKQILIQMQLCNQHAPLIAVNQLHYHKLKTLLEKIKEQKHKMSDEMQQFQFELEKFCKQDFCSLDLEKKKKVKKNIDLQQPEQMEIQDFKQPSSIIKVENEENDILNSYKEKIKKIEPGISLFIPKLSLFDQQTRNYLQQIEDHYYKELYYKEKVEQMELNSKNILQTWRQNYQILLCKIDQQKIEFQSDHN
ncbi:unnamed protein product [Paramecium sonneborni]|uniref:Uncharacterized protein n=1 Tax=Paramecium sonneborni TaxID=65129 RepID=A0A8S1PTD8_9CILI|nr:unnamed protein product [Paramecium sonneborni]